MTVSRHILSTFTPRRCAPIFALRSLILRVFSLSRVDAAESPLLRADLIRFALQHIQHLLVGVEEPTGPGGR